MTKSLVLTTAAILALSAAAASAAGPTMSSAGKGLKAFPPVAQADAASFLYVQNGTDSGIGIVSQNFETSFDIYDSQAADDFVVPAGHGWAVSQVLVRGVYFNGFGPANSEHVTFYKDAGGLPGMAVADFPAIVGTDNGTGSFMINLPTAVRLRAGTYWVSVQANLAFTVGGEWGWENQTTVVGNPAAWQNPNGGFGIGCTTWTTETTCIPDGQGDHIFALKGRSN
jgi:hypothetical protein